MKRASGLIESLHADTAGPPSGRGLLEIAAKYNDVILLNSADPDRIAPPNVLEAAATALRSGRTHYLLGSGLPQLRQAIAEKHRRENGFEVDPDRISITNGSYEGLSVAMRTLLDPGDEVLTTDPYYSGHVGAVRYAGGVPVFVPTSAERGWEPDPDEIAKRITPRTRAFLFASPGNPSGAVYRRETLEAICELARRHDFVVVADELFERFVYDGACHISAASLAGAAERVITINGFSKSYGMSGWRLGWVAGPPWFMKHFHKVRYSASMCASTFAQHGALEALSPASEAYYREVHEDYGSRRRSFIGVWERVGLPQQPAPGAYVMMIDIRRTELSSAEAARAMVERVRTLMWPATQFGEWGEGYLRVGLVQPEGRLLEFGERLAQVVVDGRFT